MFYFMLRGGSHAERDKYTLTGTLRTQTHLMVKTSEGSAALVDNRDISETLNHLTLKNKI